MTTIDATLETQLRITIVSTTFKTKGTMTIQTATTFISVTNVLFGAKSIVSQADDLIELKQGMKSMLRLASIRCKSDKQIVVAAGKGEGWFWSTVLSELR